MTDIQCINCRRPYPDAGVPFRCPSCGGVYDLSSCPNIDFACLEPELQGIWRFRHSFGPTDNGAFVSLGEGNTPLVWGKINDHQVAFKLEYLNPTGSFKDRGSALLVSFLLSRGIEAAVEDSSGNAGASFAAYAARAGIKAKVFVPDYASGPKRAQIEVYGAEVVRVLGPRSNASKAVLRAVEQGAVYASHAYLPIGLPGFATIAYELFEQLGGAPGTVVCPVGHGSLLLGIGRGFVALKETGIISNVPRLIGVQALACAPLWALSSYGAAGLGWVREGETVAEGIRITHPIHGDALFQMVESSGGEFVAVDEDNILRGRDQLARQGFYVEPTSAVVWHALNLIVSQTAEPVVAVLTGSGFKFRE